MKSFPSSVTLPSVSPEDHRLKHTLHPELWPCADPSRFRLQSNRHELFDDFNGHATVAGARFNYFCCLAYSHTLHCRAEFPRCDLGDPSPDERSAAYMLLLHVVAGRRGMFQPAVRKYTQPCWSIITLLERPCATKVGGRALTFFDHYVCHTDWQRSDRLVEESCRYSWIVCFFCGC
jgi:hypothetical protein